MGSFENGLGWSLRLPIEGLRICRRGDLDPALAEAAVAAGARRETVKVERLDWEEGREGGRPVVVASGKRRVYDAVIAADGARGLVRRTLLATRGELFAPRGESLGLGASLPGIDHGEIVLTLPGVGDAYGWIFPRPGGVSVGVAYTPSCLAAAPGGEGVISHGAARSLLSALLSRHLPVVGEASPRYRYPIPVYGPWTLPALRAAARSRILLVGDAAALADPLTREGIRYAALSGLWAAESLLAGDPGTYPERLADELDAELSRARRAREMFFEGNLGQWMVPVCRLHPGIGSVLGELMACRLPYRGLRRRLLRGALSFGPPSSGPLNAAARPAPRPDPSAPRGGPP